VANGIFNLDFIEDSTIIKLNEESIANRAFLRIVIFDAEALVLDTVDLGAKGIDAMVSSRSVSTEDRE